MSSFQFPNPVLDAKEERLQKKITERFEEFEAPGPMARGMQKLKSSAKQVLPASAVSKMEEFKTNVSKTELIKEALDVARKGFVEITKHASRFTINPDRIVQELAEEEVGLERYAHVPAVRSYEIEPLVSKDFKERALAFAEGSLTGAVGLPGIPFNLALSFFLYFRATQNVALYYGYDVRRDPRELEIASQVTIQSLSPNVDKQVDTLGKFIGKMMLATEASALRQSLQRMTYEEMASQGGAELVYVQIRALANKAAKKALRRTGKEGIEAGVFRKMLQQLGKQMPKRVGKRAIPIIGGLIGGAFDSYYMGKVLQGANLVYHKRFLLEKEERVRILREQTV